MKTTFSDPVKGMVIGFILCSAFMTYVISLIVIATCFEDWARSHAFIAALTSIASVFVWLVFSVSIYNLIHYLVFRKANKFIKEDTAAKSLSTFIEGCRNESM